MKIPRDNLVRAVFPGCELREAAGTNLRTMTGHFAVFDQWTEINSVFEGRFLERISPGAFQKTFQEGRGAMKVLFQHGHDNQVGNKPLGSIDVLEEDSRGAYYEVGLLDTSYNRDLLPGLEAGLYGASFRFAVTREDVNKTPKRDEALNPEGIPERTIREAQVMEFGPVTFPAYQGATAGVRSMTDAFTLKAFTDDPAALRALLDYNESTDSHATISVPASIPEAEADAEPEAVVEEVPVPLSERVAQLRSSLEAAEAELAEAEVEEEPTPVDASVRADAVESEQDAPPDGAEAEPHPIRGRRDKSKSYLRKETPSWQL